MRPWTGTSRRLVVAFALLIGVFGVTSLSSLRGLDAIHGDLHRVQAHSQGVRLSLELASAVRDQYAHQAHTIIIGDDSHLDRYQQATAHVLDVARQLQRVSTRPSQQAWVDEVIRASGELDTIFHDKILPAVLADDHEKVHMEHERAQDVVGFIQKRTDWLAESFETSIGEIQAQVDQVQHRTMRETLGFLLGAPLLALAVGLYITRSVARPVARLREGAARLAKGDLDAHIDEDSPDEFGALARQFNTMTGALKEQQARLVQSEKLAGIGRLAAGVAHEINNPLGVMLGYVRLMLRQPDKPAGEDLRVVEEEILRCKEIVDGLLDLARPVPSLDDRVDLRALVEDVAARLRESALPASVADISVHGAAEVQGHATRLRQIIVNLVKNAVEAAGPQGRVTVAVERRDAVARVVVEDSGPGLDAHVRSRLFEPFFTTRSSGTGLGLAVSLAMAQAHGGGIQADGSPLGGARFTLQVPAEQGRRN